MMGEFHWLRPWWLLALPVGVLLVWQLFRAARSAGSWRKVIEPALQQHVLVGGGPAAARCWPLTLALLAWVLASLALAGPAWERVGVPAVRSQDALVVALDLSRSMDAGDIAPSRLARAKLKLLALLERRTSGQTALVVFSAHAFTVTPLTDDTRTIAALVESLETDIMPSRGSYPEAGLTRAAELLAQAGAGRGEILLMSDAKVSPRALQAARDIASHGARIDVLAFGTEEGAPISRPDGGFLTDDKGAVVVAQLDAAGLRAVARAGGGRFALATPDQHDLDTLFPHEAAAGGGIAPAHGEQGAYQTDVWRDEGRWLVLLLMPLVAFAFRRGWIACLLLASVVPGTRANAFEWSDLWQRHDQQGYAALMRGDAAQASKLFDDPAWRAAAEYRAGKYAASAQTLDGRDSADAHYNRGNALAKAGDLDAAIAAYQRALELDPGHEDARYNLDLLQRAAQRRKQQQASAGSDSSDSSGAQQRQKEQQEQQAQQAQAQRQQAQHDADDEAHGAQAGARDRSGSQADSDQHPRQRPDSGSRAERQGASERGESATRPESAAHSAANPQDSGARSQDAERDAATASETSPSDRKDLEQWASQQAAEQWLRRIPQDPGGLLRRKFLYQYQRMGVDQDGNHVWPGDEAEPW
jgi:Ca-activated chloride channel homolog